jgi:hypothetical protein
MPIERNGIRKRMDPEKRFSKPFSAGLIYAGLV